MAIPERGIDTDRMTLTGAATIKLRIMHDLNLGQEPDDFWISEPRFRELLNEGVAVELRHSSDVVSVHLRGDDLARLVWPAYVHLTLLAHSYGQSR